MGPSPRFGVAAFGAVAFSLAAPAWAQVEGYPVLDNETIGLARAVSMAVEGAPETFDESQWGIELIQSFGDVGGMSPFRYLIAFSGYSVAQTAAVTPAWREPYQRSSEGFLDKMAQPIAWEDFLTVWGGADPFGPDNVMYTGHLVYMMTLHRQLFGDDLYEGPYVVVGTDGSTYQTDVVALTASIAQQADTYVDADGELVHNIACEPGRIFVPCNTPHRLSEVVHDRMYGTDYAAAHDDWLGWVRDRMVDEESQLLFDLYWPYGRYQAVPSGLPPEREPRLSGVYNAWTIWFLAALDPDWAAELYPRFAEHFVVRGEDSTFSDGRTLVVDVVGAEGAMEAVMSIVATGFAMSTARAFGDEALVGELDASWQLFFGAPEWSTDGTTLSYASSALPLVYQNAFPLLARTTSATSDVRLAGLANWSEERFDEPYLGAISDERVFVNQAVWDAAAGQLVLTVNGGDAVDSAVELEVVSLDSSAAWEVIRDGELYDGWGWSGERFVITTPPLSATLESYLVRPAGDEPDPPDPTPAEEGPPASDDPDPAGCGCADLAGGIDAGAPPTLALLLCGFAARRCCTAPSEAGSGH